MYENVIACIITGDYTHPPPILQFTDGLIHLVQHQLETDQSYNWPQMIMYSMNLTVCTLIFKQFIYLIAMD